MIYLVFTQNGDVFQTTDKPEECYKTQIAFGGWTAFRYDTTSVQPYQQVSYSAELGFIWISVPTLQ